MHFSIEGVSSIALSAIFFNSIIFSPLNPPSAVINSLHLASLILSANDLAENPAKTTE